MKTFDKANAPTMLDEFDKANARTMLISLTKEHLIGYANPAQSDSILLKSWNMHFFLKSVRVCRKRGMGTGKRTCKLCNFKLEPKDNLLHKFVRLFGTDMEQLIEKDFFFHHTGKKKLPEDIKKFQNGFDDYIVHVKKQDETLLPKIFCLFGIQVSGILFHFHCIYIYSKL
jgi:hypothetical protein